MRQSGSRASHISYVQDTTETAFCIDMQKQDAVIIRRIEIIAEATAHLTEETRHSCSQLSFRQMRGMRNIVAHDYGNVDPKTIGEVATIHVPNVCSVRENFLRVRGDQLPVQWQGDWLLVFVFDKSSGEKRQDDGGHGVAPSGS